MNRVGDEGRGIVNHARLETFGKPRAQLVQRRIHGFRYRNGVRTRREIHADGNGRFAIQPAERILILGAQLNAGDILHLQH